VLGGTSAAPDSVAPKFSKSAWLAPLAIKASALAHTRRVDLTICMANSLFLGNHNVAGLGAAVAQRDICLWHTFT
jgi:hypothetical protein